MGEVYRARDARLSRDVAIKILPDQYSVDQDRLRRFEQEARSTGMLNHPNILSVFDFGKQNGSTYIVSELLEGQTLREVLKESRLSQKKAIDYGLQIAHGLAAAHEKGIIHRDLKPENLFVTKDGRVKILYFGLAKLKQPDAPQEQLTQAPTMTRHTSEGVIFGTIGYMSPEQVRASAVDHRSDLFTFGAILFEMLTGKAAFVRESKYETLNAILKEDPFESFKTGTSLNPGLETIIHHCLEKNPSERFQSARDLAFHLQTISTANTTSPLVLPESKRTKRISLLQILAIALPIAAVIGFLLGRNYHPVSNKNVTAVSLPTYQSLTQRRGYLASARFAPDGNSIIYSASWNGGPVQLYTTRPENPESSALTLPPASIFAISSKGEMAISVRCEISGYSGSCAGTLATVPIAGGAPREISEHVISADWSPDGEELMAAINLGNIGHIEYPIGKTIYKTKGIILLARLSPKGDRIAFFESQISDYSLVMIDLDGHKKVLSTGWGRGTGLCWLKNSNEIWISGPKKGTGYISGIDIEGHERIVLRTPGGLRINDVSQDGRVLLTSQFGRVQLVARPPDSTKEIDLSWFTNSHPADLSDDGKNLLLTDLRSGAYAMYLRKTDGSPAVLLGLGGEGLALSPDQKWVVSRSQERGLVFYPTGPGQPKHFKIDMDASEDFARWFPDNSRILFDYAAPGQKMRAWSIDMHSGKSQPLTTEGVVGYLISKDGNAILVSDENGKFSIVSVSGGSAKQVKGIEPDDFPIQWSDDGRSIFVVKDKAIYESIDRIDLLTGHRTLVTDIRPSDPAGVVFSVGIPRITPDGKFYVYGFHRILGDLYLATGLQ